MLECYRTKFNSLRKGLPGSSPHLLGHSLALHVAKNGPLCCEGRTTIYIDSKGNGEQHTLVQSRVRIWYSRYLLLQLSP